MSEPHDETRLWPASPFHLGDAHRCPSCFVVISAPVCTSCGFALTDPRAVGVLELGREILAVELERQQLMAEIRLDPRPAVVPEPLPAPAPLTPVVAAAPVPEPVAAAPATAGSAAPPQQASAGGIAVAPASAPRRRLSVPVLLLMVGVSLVGVAAVFFLLLAWFVAGIAVRALIVGGITVATIGLASWLRRRGLAATAEGVGALGVVLLALDAWAVRANDLFGAGSSDGAFYAGTAALVVAIVCRLWSRLSHLRGPGLAASVALPAGLGLVLGGLTSLPLGEAVTAGLLGAAVGGLAHALPAPWSAARTGAEGEPERLVLAVGGIAALVAAALTATTLTGSALPVVVWASAAVGVLGGMHAWLLLRPPADERLPAATALSAVAVTAAVVMASTAGWQLASRTELPVYALLVGPLVAVAVAFALDLLRTRLLHERAFAPAAVVAAVIALLSLAGEVIAWLWHGAAALDASWTQWRTDAFALPIAAGDAPFLPAVTAVCASAVLLVSPSLRREPAREFRPTAVVVLVITAALYTAVPGVLVGTAALAAAWSLAVPAVVARRRSRAIDARRTDAETAVPTPPGAGWAIAGALAATVAYLAGTATPWLWIVGILIAAAYPVVLGLVFRPGRALVAASAVAPVVVGAVSALLAPDAFAAAIGMSDAARLPGRAAVVSIALLQWVALAAFAAALWVRAAQTTRTAVSLAAEVLVAMSLAWTAAVAISGVLGASAWPLDEAIGEPVLGIPRTLALLCALAFFALGRTRLASTPAVGAAALLAPTAAATVFAVLGAFGAREAGWAPLVLTAAAAAVPVVAASLVAPRLARAAADAEWGRRRLAADAGAGIAALTVVWGVASGLEWAALAIVALGLAAASVTAGWAAPARDDDLFTTRREGVRAPEAPRRLLAWPAVAAALTTWWSWLGAGTPSTAFTLESYTLPAAAVLVGFAVALTWLRRRLEASIALGAGLAIGLWSSATDGWSGDPLGGTIAAVTAAAICLTLSFTPLRGIRPASVVGACAAVVGVGLVAVERAVAFGGGDMLWLVLLVAVAYASAVGFVGAAPERASSSLYALIVPVVTLGAAVLAAATQAHEPLVVAGALAVLALLHVAASARDRAPFSAPTRWSALAGAVVVAGAGLIMGAVDELEAVTLPVAAMCLGGSALAMLRRRRSGAVWPGPEAPLWLGGLGLATVPSLFAADEPVRVWSLIIGAIVAAGALAAWRVPASRPASTEGSRSGIAALRVPTALVLAGAALAMGLRVLASPAQTSGPAAMFAAAAGAVAVAILLTATAETERHARVPAGLAAVAAVLLAMTTLTRTDGDLAQTAVIATVGGVAGVCGAAVLGLRRWAALGAVFAVGGAAAAGAACGGRFVSVARTPDGEADLWALAGAGIVVAIGLAALRATPSRHVGHVVGAGFAIGAALYAAAVATLLAVQQTDDGVRTAVAMSALTAATVLGVASRARLGSSLAVVGGVAGAALGVVALTAFGVRPVELVTIPPALGGIAYGAIVLRRDPAARTWPALGPWLALLLVPSLLHDFGETELWRVVGLGVMAIALVVLGAVYRLQAPLVLGSAVVVVHAIAQLWPWISAAYVAVPWWLWLGLGGALLIFIAARYERRVQALRAAFTAVTSLR